MKICANIMKERYMDNVINASWIQTKLLYNQ